MEIEGKNVLITGGAKRLGRAMAITLAERGANIAIHYHHSKEEALELIKILQDNGLAGTAIKANIGNPKEIIKTVEEAQKYLGQLDILINNAAIFYPTPIDQVSEKDWDRFLNVNLKAQFYFAREFAKLKPEAPAKIINMAGGYGASPSAEFIPYGVSKGGVIALTKGLAKAYSPEILVNCICPGPILLSDRGDEQSQERAVSSTLLKREGCIEDITKTVLFLTENDYITGQAIFVDGGKHV